MQQRWPANLGWSRPGEPSVYLRLWLSDPADFDVHYGQGVLTGIEVEGHALIASNLDPEWHNEVDIEGHAFATREIFPASYYDDNKRPAVVVLRSPLPFAERLLSYFYWHYAAETKKLPGRSYANCHTLTAALQNWVTADELNPNIIGSGSLRVDHIDEMDAVVTTDPSFALRPGEAYGIPRREHTFQVDMAHSFTAIDPKGDFTLSMAGWDNPIVLASLPSLQEFYKNYGCHPSIIGHIPTKPAVIDTDDWREKITKLHGGGYDGRAEVAKLEDLIQKKPLWHEAFVPGPEYEKLLIIRDGLRDAALQLPA
jgi:hypothetical protein